jgi:hypothetical protein
LGLVWLSATSVAAQSNSGPSFSLPSKGSEVVVRLIEEIDGIESTEAGPTTTVFADGRVVVERPSYMKQAGRHETRLSPEVLRVWLAGLLETGVTEFDSDRTRGDKRAADRAHRLKRVGRSGTEVFARSSASRIDFELHVDAFRSAAKGLGPEEEVRKKIYWRGLRRDASRYPELEDIQSLEAAVGMTRTLGRESIVEAIGSAQ